ncbi:MAG: ABC transporter substrate-binding protein [Clostridiales bacterium]|nr:ABC transporter substrate-binding protein [Clostridiales bacterium]
MKKLVALLLTAMMLLGVVGMSAETAVHPVGGEIIYGSSTEISGDWSHGAIWTNNATDNMIRGLMNDYDTIVFNDGGALVVNDSTAESVTWEDNEDGTKTFTVKIAEDLVFNDGTPITAQHYLASLLLFNHPTLITLGSKSTGYLTYVGGDAYKTGEATAFSGARLIDEYTYSLTVVEEKLPYFYDLSYASLSPLSINMWLGSTYSVADDGEGAYIVGDMAVGTLAFKIAEARFLSEGRVTAGPYNLVSYDKGAKQAVLEINPLYKGKFDGQKPSVQKIIVVKAEDATQFDALKTGEINLISALTGGDDVNAALDIVAGGGFDTVTFERAGYGKLMFQCDFGPTQFLNVRHAIAHLLDRPEFANTFTGGYGGVVHGPYGLAMWMYQDGEEELSERLNTYPYSLEDAVKLLEEDGWVLGEDGQPWVSGLRYKEVTEEEAGEYKHNITVGDKVLMPLIIEWSSSEGNTVSELLVTMLAENPDVASAGFEIRQNIMTFAELLNYMYRDKSVGEQYGVPTYGMYNLASNFNPIYDQSYSWTLDPELVEQGYNVNFLFDEQLDKLSMDMVYGVNADDPDTYLKIWIDYIVRWNELLPEVPLYSNIYYTIFFDKLHGYAQNPYWGFENAIVYSWIE